MKVAIALYGRAYEKTAPLLPYTDLNYRVFPLNGYTGQPLPITALRWAKQYIQRDAYHSLRDWKPDVLYTNCGISTRGDMNAIYSLGIPIVVRLGGYIYGEGKENAQGWPVKKVASMVGYKTAYTLIKRAKRLVVVSKHMAEEITRFNGRSMGDISIISVPCNIERFNLSKIDSGRILIVTHTNFKAKTKALNDFLPALEGYNVKIIAPGKYQDSVTSNHEVLGFTQNIETEYQKASVFCYFSYLDGCPNVILEAWASHTPIVANRCGWSLELIKHGETGLLVNTVGEAKEAVKSLLNDVQLRRKLADNGFEYVSTHHNIEKAGVQLGRILKEVN